MEECKYFLGQGGKVDGGEIAVLRQGVERATLRNATRAATLPRLYIQVIII